MPGLRADSETSDHLVAPSASLGVSQSVPDKSARGVIWLWHYVAAGARRYAHHVGPREPWLRLSMLFRGLILRLLGYVMPPGDGAWGRCLADLHKAPMSSSSSAGR